jgi:hypothetical protein
MHQNAFYAPYKHFTGQTHHGERLNSPFFHLALKKIDFFQNFDLRPGESGDMIRL